MEPKIIKGCPRDKWDEVQALQGEPFIYIMSNGSKWAGEEEDDVQDLLAVLAEHPLDPRFEDYGNFINPHPCVAVRDDDGKWVDGDRQYQADVTSFFGNFLGLSHVFNIDTNHQPTIDALTTAIKANVATTAYQAARPKPAPKPAPKVEPQRDLFAAIA